MNSKIKKTCCATSRGITKTKNVPSKIFNILLFLFFLFSQCLMACGQVSYSYVSYVDTGFCGSESGRGALGTKADCEAAAVSLNYGSTSAHVRSWSIYPPGCWKSGSTALYFNTLTTSTITCGGTSSWPCLCATGPLCSKTEGTTANSAGCICGAAACTPTTGLYCISSLNFCGKICTLGEYRSAGTNGVCT